MEGNLQEDKTYYPHDVVESRGSSFSCRSTCTGISTSSTIYWERMTKRGDVTNPILTTRGDILQQSNLTLARIPAGKKGQVLTGSFERIVEPGRSFTRSKHKWLDPYSGHTVALKHYENSTRQAFALKSHLDVFVEFYNQKSFLPMIKIEVHLIGYGAFDKTVKWRLTYDNVTYDKVFFYNYTNQLSTQIVTGQLLILGSSAPGRKRWILEYNTNRQGNGRPFTIFNPNSADNHSVTKQMISSVTFTEIKNVPSNIINIVE